MQKLISLLILPVLFACRDGYKVKTVYKPISVTEPEVASWVKVLNDQSGTIGVEAEAGVAQYAGRLLDANCSAPVKDLGTKAEPKFSLPADAYYQSLCLETKYFDSKGNVVKVKMQPIKIDGPEPLAMELPQDNQLLDFNDVEGAAYYAFMVLDSDGAIVSTESGVSGSSIDFKNSLKLKDYKVIILAMNSAGENLKAINIKLKVVPGAAKDPILLGNLKFERLHYQTRSIKRVLFPDAQLSGTEQMEIDGTPVSTLHVPSYSGAFAALLSATDAMMRGVLPYGGSSVAISIEGLPDNLTPVGVTVRDFTSFAVLSSGYSDGSYEKSGLEAWVSTFDNASVQSGGNDLASTFGLMIIQ